MEKSSMCIAKWEVVDGDTDEEMGTLNSSPNVLMNQAASKRSAHGYRKGDLSKVARTNSMKSTYVTTTMAMVLAMSVPQGWAELPGTALDCIIRHLSCTRDLLAFIATCPTWRAVFMEAKASYCKLFPPLLVRSCAQLGNDAHSEVHVHHAWQLRDPANPSTRFHRPAPAGIPPGMRFVGCSFGHAIFADLSSVSDTGGRITMVDVFTGVQVSPPVLPQHGPPSLHFIDLLCCALTAPISSPNACLLVSTGEFYGLHVWRIGSDGWVLTESEYAELGVIDQVVVFGDKIIALDCDLSLFTVHLDNDPQLGLGARIKALLIVDVDPEDEDDDGGNRMVENARLMVCEDKLALVGSPTLKCDSLVYFYLRGWGLDDSSSSTEPLSWSPVPPEEELGCQVFISGAHGRPVFYDGRYGRWALSRANPERWGGRRGFAAYAGYRDEVYPFASAMLPPSWVTPSALLLDE